MAADRITLLLVPGTLYDEALWAHQVAHLGDLAEIRVADVASDDHVDAMASRALAEAPPGPVAVAGLSLGGFVALACWRAAPERVRKLALLGTSARPDDPGQAAMRAENLALARAGELGEVARRMLPHFIHRNRLEEEPLRSDVTAMALRVGVDAYLGQQAANASRPDCRAELSAIACPTLVVCGRQDTLLPLEHSAEIAAAIAGAALVPVERCGHLSPMEQPQAVTALLRYWLLRR